MSSSRSSNRKKLKKGSRETEMALPEDKEDSLGNLSPHTRTAISNLMQNVGTGGKLDDDGSLVWKIFKNEGHSRDLKDASKILIQAFPSQKKDIQDLMSEKIFFIVGLIRDKRVCCAALVRVFGGASIAEVRYMATRKDLRKKGLGKALIKRLESVLSEVGIGRIVLPVTTSAIRFWMNCQFTRMGRREDEERLCRGLLQYNEAFSMMEKTLI